VRIYACHDTNTLFPLPIARPISRRTIDVEGAYPDDFYRARDFDAPKDGSESTVVCVRNLPPEARIAEVRAVFDGYALAPEVPDARTLDPNSLPYACVVGHGPAARLTHNVYMGVKLDSGKPRGEAYVVFADASSAILAARDLDKKLFGERYLEMDVTTRGEVYTQTASCIEKGLGIDPDYDGCLHFKGLAPDTTPEALAGGLASFPIDALFMGKRSDTRFSGDAIVVFSTREAAAEAATAFAGGILGRPLDGAPRFCLKAEGAALVGGLHILHADANVRNVVHVRGIPFKATPEQIIGYFTKYGATIRDVYVHHRFDGKPAGDAFVKFDSEEAAGAAADANVRIDFPDRAGAACYVVAKRDLYDAITRPPCEPGRDAFPTTIPYEHLDVVLRCKGVPFETRESDIENFFGGFGCIRVHLYTDKNNGKTLGESVYWAGKESRLLVHHAGTNR
jgi:RNA recognition motif-containing protein